MTVAALSRDLDGDRAQARGTDRLAGPPGLIMMIMIIIMIMINANH